MTCECYHANRNFLGEVGVCWGTKEREPCSCGGDETKCNFYDYIRERAKKVVTNADRIRAMTDEELAKFLDGWTYSHCTGTPVRGCPPHNDCELCALNWLKREVDDG